MNEFNLHVPTIKDIELVWNTLSVKQRDLLHWHPVLFNERGKRFYGEFHLADGTLTDPERHAVAGGRAVDGVYVHTTSKQEPLAFRPVLKPTDGTDLSCIKDGTIIHMGAFMLGLQGRLPIPGEDECPPAWPERNSLGGPLFALDPYAQGKEDSIGWMKVGDLLIADRCLLCNVTYQQLEEQHITVGAPVKMPFDQAVSNLFFDQAMEQPLSSQRTIAEVMHSLACDTKEADKDKLFKIAEKVYDCWLSGQTDLSLDDATYQVSEMMRDGIFAAWKDADGLFDETQFSPEAVVDVILQPGIVKVGTLINYNAEHFDSVRTTDGAGSCTPHGELIAALQHSEEKVLKTKRSLDQMISGAQSRTAGHGEADHEQSRDGNER